MELGYHSDLIYTAQITESKGSTNCDAGTPEATAALKILAPSK